LVFIGLIVLFFFGSSLAQVTPEEFMGIPSFTNAELGGTTPASPAVYFNTDEGTLNIYNGTQFKSLAVSSLSNVSLNAGTGVITYTMSDGTTKTIDLTLAAAAIAAVGPTGPIGPTGVAGAQGVTGTQGPTGPAGSGSGGGLSNWSRVSSTSPSNRNDKTASVNCANGKVLGGGAALNGQQDKVSVTSYPLDDDTWYAEAKKINGSNNPSNYTLTVWAICADASTGSTGSTGGGGPPFPACDAACQAAVIDNSCSYTLNTTAEKWYVLERDVNGWQCSNFDGRAVQINGQAIDCGVTPLPAKIDNKYYFYISAGTFSWAAWTCW
jgi:hypothetical protein